MTINGVPQRSTLASESLTGANSVRALRTPSIVLVSDYAPGYLGGAQTALRAQAGALADAGCRVTVVGPDGGPRDARWVSVPVTAAVRVPGTGMPLVRASNRRVRELTAVLRDATADAVVLHSEFGIAAAALHAAHAAGLPVAHVVHTFFWRAPSMPAVVAHPLASAVRAAHTRLTRLPPHRAHVSRAPLDDAMRRATAAIADAADVVLSPSRHQARALREAGISGVRVLSNVVPDAPTSATGPHAPGPRLRVLWAGRATPEKGLYTLLEAVAHLAPEDVEVHVAGRGPGLDRMRKRPGPGIVDLGLLDADDMAAAIEACDVVAITSLGFDNQPMLALEAFRGGRPLVVIDPVLADEFGDAALRAPEPDAHGLARLLARLATRPPELAAAAQAATTRAAETSPSQHTTSLLTALGLDHCAMRAEA